MGDIRSLIRQSPPVDITNPYDPQTLNDKTILITGGANGFGSHMARHWASFGAHIIIGDVSVKSGEELVAGLRIDHPRSTFAFQHCDVTDWESQVDLFDLAVRVSPHSSIDIVVPNAGIILPGEASIFENPSLIDGKLPKPNTATLDVNIKGVTYTTHLAIHHLSQNPRPDRCILLIGSLSSLLPFPGQCQYAMSKHAVLGLFRTLRSTAFFNGIRINMIAPYYTAQTSMLKPAVEAIFLGGSAGPGSISDVVDASTRLIADESIAGRSLVIGPRLKTTNKQDGDGSSTLVVENDKTDGQGVWECYADDYNEVDAFTKRYITLLNAVTKVRGWFGLVTDWLRILRRK